MEFGPLTKANKFDPVLVVPLNFGISQLPMAQPSDMSMPPPPPPPQPSLAQVMVVSPLCCAPNPVNLTIVRKVMTTSNDRFEVTDLSDNIVFKVRGPGLAWHYRLTLLDAAGNPLLTLQPKIRSRHGRWKAYRGESTDEKDLLFSVKLSSLLQFRHTKLHVFLANNTQEDHCDFRVETSSLIRSCVIYAGDSNSVVAQMQRECKFFGQEKYMVSVFPNMDAAFVAAIIVILDEISSNGE